LTGRTATAGAPTVIRYDLGAHPFPAAVRTLLGGTPLTALGVAGTGSNDQDTDWHARFYAGFERIRGLYDALVREVVAPLHGEDLCVQAVPTFRVHPPRGRAVREFHRDSDYNHQPGIVNYWLPLTPASGTNSIWIESEPDSGRFAPAELGPGDLLRFDGARLRHGNLVNDTGSTRASFDFRVLPLREYRDDGLSTVTAGRRLRLGDYYSLLRWTGP
jgi:hypothetical protein